jgi:hypothetical protein
MVDKKEDIQKWVEFISYCPDKLQNLCVLLIAKEISKVNSVVGHDLTQRLLDECWASFGSMPMDFRYWASIIEPEEEATGLLGELQFLDTTSREFGFRSVILSLCMIYMRWSADYHKRTDELPPVYSHSTVSDLGYVFKQMLETKVLGLDDVGKILLGLNVTKKTILDVWHHPELD